MNATKEKQYFTDLHQNHLEWMKELQFYKDDIKVFTSRLEEVAKANTKADVLSQVEHFQNQFSIQRNEIDFLMHDIKLKEESLIKYVKEHPVAIDRVHFKPELDLIERINTFEDLWKKMRSEFMSFVSKAL